MLPNFSMVWELCPEILFLNLNLTVLRTTRFKEQHHLRFFSFLLLNFCIFIGVWYKAYTWDIILIVQGVTQQIVAWTFGVVIPWCVCTTGYLVVVVLKVSKKGDKTSSILEVSMTSLNLVTEYFPPESMKCSHIYTVICKKLKFWQNVCPMRFFLIGYLFYI